MSLPVRVMLATVVLCVCVLVDGNNQRIINVSNEQFHSDSKNFFDSGDCDSSLNCGLHKNCSCNSFDEALVHLTNFVLINITTNVTLSSLIQASNLSNVSIIGHNKPTIKCKDAGGIHFNFSHNFIIQDIILDGCGTITDPVFKFVESFNILIKSCSFQDSKGQAVALSEVSGHVNVSHSNFEHNRHYADHGAAVHYSSGNITNNSQLSLAISNCNFTYNTKAKSLVYTESILQKPDSNDSVIFQNLKFYLNEGVSLHIANQNISLHGNFLFQNAENGTGIYIKDHSIVILGKDSNVVFTQNIFLRDGVVFLTNHSRLIFDHNSVAVFIGNEAFPGVIYSEVNSNVTFQEDSKVKFSGNTAIKDGAIVNCVNNCHIAFTGNSNVVFINNKLHQEEYYYYGGILFLMNHAHVSFEQNSNAYFSSNRAYNGAAIRSNYHSSISFKGKSSAIFNDNTARMHGGAIQCDTDCFLSFEENSNTQFIGNTAGSAGGAINCSRSHICFQGNSTTLFSNNAAIDGGAILGGSCYITFYGKSTAKFINNTAIGSNNPSGGAIYGCCISFEGNSTTEFTNNTAYAGGAISYLQYLTFRGSSTSNFINNFALFFGGALYAFKRHVSLTFEHDSTTRFSGNQAIFTGAAICSVNASISFIGKSSTIFNNNTAISGGGIQCFGTDCFLSFEENSNAIFSGNSASFIGGAIHCSQCSYIFFQGNSNTLFSNNIASNGGAIWADSSNITFYNKSTVKFINNGAISPSFGPFSSSGGAIFGWHIFFEGNSITEFTGNTAYFGGAIYFQYLTFKDNSTSNFTNNNAQYGGAMHVSPIGNVLKLTFEQNSSVIYYKNMARENGGAIYFSSNSIYFRGYSHTKFINNIAETYGGALYSGNSFLYFEENSATNFSHNIAAQGGAIYTAGNDAIYFSGLSATVFSNNIANEYGGAIAVRLYSNINFNGSSTVTFTDNRAPFGETAYGGSKSGVKTVGYSTIIFNGALAKWCVDVCLPYTGEGDVIIDGNGIVWCSDIDEMAFACEAFNCQCKHLEHFLRGLSNHSVVDISDFKLILSARVRILSLTNVSIIGHNNLTVFCDTDYLHYIYIHISSCRNFLIEGITWIGCGGHHPGTYGFQAIPAIVIASNSAILIQKCTFQYLRGPAFDFNNLGESEVIIKQCNFMKSSYYREHGTAIYRLASLATITVSHCKFSYDEGVKSIIYLKDDVYGQEPFPKAYAHIYINNSSFHNAQGVCIYVSDFNVLISGKVLFKNSVAIYGAGIFIRQNSTLIFGENSNIQFINNSAEQNGSAIFLKNYSMVIFDKNSIAEFIDNKGIFGTIYSANSSNITFRGTSQVLFNGNFAMQCGAAIYSYHNSHVTFREMSNATISGNVVTISERLTDLTSGGAIFSSTNSHITFDGNSTVIFHNNTASTGAAIFSFYKSNVEIKGGSKIRFNSNTAQYCGILTLALFSNLSFTSNAEVTFTHNMMLCTSNNNYRSSAGGICSLKRSNVMFLEQSFVAFINNTAEQGGAAVFSETNVYTKDHSKITFDGNVAEYSNGGAFVCCNSSIIMITDNSNVTFNGNMATQSGGAIHSYNMCKIMFKGKSTSSFIKNTARNNGGALVCIKLGSCSYVLIASNYLQY